MNIRIFAVFRGNAPIYVGRNYDEAANYKNAQDDKDNLLLMFRDTDDKTGLWQYARPVVGAMKGTCHVA
jgi:hypothetical protein